MPAFILCKTQHCACGGRGSQLTTASSSGPLFWCSPSKERLEMVWQIPQPLSSYCWAVKPASKAGESVYSFPVSEPSSLPGLERRFCVWTHQQFQCSCLLSQRAVQGCALWGLIPFWILDTSVLVTAPTQQFGPSAKIPLNLSETTALFATCPTC